uniref:Kringle domain-containing protein n=1 Tax=Caenorhabditis japonica TaxID=281687 RepID=A0A8R1IU45_CAEJA
MKSYQYLGNLDKSMDGASCVPWKVVTESWWADATPQQKQKKKPTENFHHSKCRTLNLDTNHLMVNATDAMSLKITSGKFGPWCFIAKNDNKYIASACFPACNESRVTSLPPRKKFTENGYTNLKLNYNPQVIDSIEKLFGKYDLGNKKYYVHKKSHEQPPQYMELRRNVFFALCILFFAVITWILACHLMKKYSQKVHQRKQKVLEKFLDTINVADIRLQTELRREQEDA